VADAAGTHALHRRITPGTPCMLDRVSPERANGCGSVRTAEYVRARACFREWLSP
jgi:hypothetical protein